MSTPASILSQDSIIFCNIITSFHNLKSIEKMDLTHVRNMMDNIPKGATINIKSVSQKLLDMVKKGDMEQSTMDLIIETMMSYKSREVSS